MRKQVMTLVCSFAMTSCAPSYVYRPASNATDTPKGRVAADYQIPPTAPQGVVRLVSFGMSKISPSGRPNEHQKAVHVRMIVTDNSRTRWAIDTRQQIIALPNGQQLAPTYVTAHEGQAGLPSVTIPASGKRIVDLFYPLPPDMQSASRVPEFDVIWHVKTPQQQVTESTRFDRLRVEPAVGLGYSPEWSAWDDGWAGPFWYDSRYPGYGGDIFIGAPHWGGWEEARERHEERAEHGRGHARR